MLVTKKKYDKLARDYQRLYFEYQNYVVSNVAKKKATVKPLAIKKTETKKAK